MRPVNKHSTLLALLSLSVSCAVQSAPTAGDNWFSYGGDPGGTHYSSLRQITKENVSSLKEVWRFEAPDPGSVQTTPLIIDGTMYVTSPRQKVIALDAATGKQKWVFDSGVGTAAAIRGLSWWTDGKERRLFSAVASYIYAIDPATGKAIASFGDQGRIDLRANLRGKPADNAYHATSPAVVYKDLLILGGRVSETPPASPGDERAYDVRSGKLRWTFHTIPQAGEPGAETWPKGARHFQGGANAWAGSIVDTDRGIAFIATGSPADDFYGVTRAGDNLYANCVIALDANTGKRLWHFQATHHDLWDSDFAAPPSLLTVNSEGKRVAAVAATNKMGFVYIFDRVTGKPLFPIVETKVPASTVPGEAASLTQPIPTLPAALNKLTLSRDEVTNRTPEMRAWAQQQYDTFLGAQQPFTPLSIGKVTMVTPGWKGGVEWGGMTSDPEKGILYANVNNVFSLGSLADSSTFRRAGQGERAYRQQCMLCHGAEKQGTPPAIPSIVDVGKRLSAEEITTVIQKGRNAMPPFPALQPQNLANLVSFLTTGADAAASAAPRNAAAQAPSKYVFTGYSYFNDPEGYPAGPMPWGTLSAIDMNTGKYLWTVPFGEYTELAAKGMTDTGSGSHGGSALTATGVLFTGGSENDLKFRAYDSATGKLIWSGALPGHGIATPAVYAVNGKQYVVIASSPARGGAGAELGSAAAPRVSATSYVVFALP
jgi:quinoprotein glucose dehydrogenase